jgi:hypothetical protein
VRKFFCGRVDAPAATLIAAGRTSISELRRRRVRGERKVEAADASDGATRVALGDSWPNRFLRAKFPF